MPKSEASGESPHFWNVNVDPANQTTDCPDYLQYAMENDKDRAILATPDDQYQRMSWEKVQQIIRDNQIDQFVRVPSDLRLYRQYNAKISKKYGSVMDFVTQQRLQWSDTTPSGSPMFQDPSDYKILFNDWPYGIDKRIVHLVVWVKFELPVDPESSEGDLTQEARKEIDAWVDGYFVKKCGKENVIWFKNWTRLKSIHSVEHIHVMLFDPDKSFVSDITHGDVALQDKISKEDGSEKP